MTKTWQAVLMAAFVAVATLAVPMTAGATSRIKDLANVEGVRDNQLIGYGLVVGLNGTGDTLNNIPFTKQSLQAMLERLGVNVRGQTMRTGNVAAVMVTANLPAFATQGMAAWVPTIEMSINVRSLPKTPWVKACFRSRYITCGLVEEDGELWDEEGNLLAISRQIAQFRKTT